MPFINGRFYMNPAYGRAFERARGNRSPQDIVFVDVARQNEKQDSSVQGRGGTSGSAAAGKHATTKYENPQNEQEARLANVVYNETSSLRSKAAAASEKPGSASDLRAARVAVAEVAHKVMESGHPERVAPSELTAQAVSALNRGDSQAVQAHNDSLAAARQALDGSATTGGATQYRLRSAPNVHTPINGKHITSHFGPFDDSVAKGRTKTVVVAP